MKFPQLLALLGCVLLFPRLSAQTYPVYIATEDSNPEIVRAVQFAIHPWLSYLRYGMEYREGTTIRTGGQVEVRIDTAEEVIAVTGNLATGAYTQRWIYLDGGTLAFAEIVMNGSSMLGWDRCASHTLVHEFGHVHFIGHSSSYTDLMYFSQVNCRAVVTLDDVALLPKPVYPTCTSQITKENDLFIPFWEGQEAYLEYKGNNLWKLIYLGEVTATSSTNCIKLESNLDFVVHHATSPEWDVEAYFVYQGNDIWLLDRAIELQGY